MRVVSYAQNNEDAMLNRVFGSQQVGFYVDIGADHPVDGSVTKLFYDRGWSGINVEPNSIFDMLAAERPRDVNLRMAVLDRQGVVSFRENTPHRGMSHIVDEDDVGCTVPCDTLEAIIAKHAIGRPIDFIKIDAEGSEPAIVLSTDWRRLRPRVLIIEATKPVLLTKATKPWRSVLVNETWEPNLLADGYVRAYFDGINCFYVRDEEWQTLEYHFRSPINVLDDVVTHAHAAAITELATARESLAAVQRDLGQQLITQNERMAVLEERIKEERSIRATLKAHLDEESKARAALAVDLLAKSGTLEELYASTSWRIAAPLRCTKRVARSFMCGARAWVTLKRGSRPMRIAARCVVGAVRFCSTRPLLETMLRQTLRWLPAAVKTRLQRIIPSDIRPGPMPATHADDVLLLCEPLDIRTGYRRLRAAEANIGSTSPAVVEDPPVARDHVRPRLAFVSPLPPERTGVADYSAELLPALSSYYDIDAIVAPDPRSIPLAEGCHAIRHISWFERHAHSYDRIVYNIGNSTFHQHMFSLLQKFPGVVVLHDFYLGNLLAFLEMEGGWHGYWTRALYDAHGYEAVRQRFRENGQDNVIRDYPANLSILQQAPGVIVHNEFSRALVRRFYGGAFSNKLVVIPLARQLPPHLDRPAARASLGIAEDEFLVCSFGILSESKLNHRLVQAWLATRLKEKRRCRLVFVGEAPPAYLNKLRESIRYSSGKTNIRVTGYVPPQLFRQYLAAADVAVQLRCQSRGESSGTLLDCMVHGLPLIVNAHGSFAELPDAHVVKLADNFEQAALVAALERLEAEPAVRAILGRRARNLITKEFAPARIAIQYRDAVENFAKSAPPFFDTKALFRIAGDLPQVAGVRDCLTMARNLAKEAAIRQPSRQLLVDVSAMVRVDLQTGIQRVVRAQLLALLNSPPEGFRIEPVWLCEASGRWHLRYARRHTLKLLGITREDLDDEPVAAGQDDIYYMPDYFNDGVARAADSGVYAKLRDRGVRINFLIYDNLPISMPQHFPEGTEKIHEAWLRTIAANADQLICISRDVAEDTRHWLKQKMPTPPYPPMIDFVHLGADIDASSPSTGMPTGAPKVLEALASRTTFLMVGTVEPRKGYSQVLDAFDELWAEGANINLVVVGAEGWKSIPDHGRRSIPQIVARLRGHVEWNSRLFWLTGVSDEYLNRIYASSVCLVAASEGEGFGLPLIEAAKHRLAILARDIPIFREVAGEHAAYFSGMRGGDLADRIRHWITLYSEGRQPKSHNLPWITWETNVELLKAILVGKTELARQHDPAAVAPAAA
jgi:FkbM family methyltransferase